jgi:cell wall-associated NlpC family hydrolase
LLQLLLERGVVKAGTAALQPAVGMAEQARDWAAEAVVAAMAFLDIPYAYGGSSLESGFDCSGFTRHVFKHTLGLLLPRSAEQQAQASALQTVAAEELKPGDLVFFNTLRKAYSHVGIYVGEGRFVHAPRTGAAVRLDSMQKSYWSTRFDGARRALPATPPVPSSPARLTR